MSLWAHTHFHHLGTYTCPFGPIPTINHLRTYTCPFGPIPTINHLRTYTCPFGPIPTLITYVPTHVPLGPYPLLITYVPTHVPLGPYPLSSPTYLHMSLWAYTYSNFVRTCTCPFGPIVPDSTKALWLLTHRLQ